MISPGTKVSEGQPVMELETDKAVVEVPSSVTGTVKEIKVKEGEKIKVGQVIFTLEGGATAQPEKAKHAPVEHISEQHEARLAFQAAIQAEGKTEEQVFCPISRSQPLPRHSPCRRNWAKSRARSIASLYPPRRTCAAWRANSASIFTTSKARARADASAKTTSRLTPSRC